MVNVLSNTKQVNMGLKGWREKQGQLSVKCLYMVGPLAPQIEDVRN